MAKRQKSKQRIPTDGRATPKHNPFAAALSGMSARPAAEEAVIPSDSTDVTESIGPVRTRIERKGHGGKTVTIVTGVPASRADEIAQKLRAALGTGVRVGEDSLIVQGDLQQRVAAWFDHYDGKA